MAFLQAFCGFLRVFSCSLPFAGICGRLRLKSVQQPKQPKYFGRLKIQEGFNKQEDGFVISILDKNIAIDFGVFDVFGVDSVVSCFFRN